MRSNRENGSLASYIIVGVLLMVVLVSGLYGVQRYNDSQQENGSNQPADKPRNDTNDAPADKKPAEDTPPATDDGSGDVPTVDEDTTDEAANDTAADDDLPATGPEDTLATAAVLFVATFALSSFIRARYWTSRDN